MRIAVKSGLRTVVALGIIASALGLSACATTNTRPQSSESIIALNDAVNSVSEQLQLLNASQQATSGQGAHIYPIPQTGVMATQITLNWSGPLEPAVRSVAQLVGYHFQVLGQSPSSPILVSVDAHQQPAFSVLQDIGWQGGDAVGVVVRPEKRLIAITYKGQEKGSS